MNVKSNKQLKTVLLIVTLLMFFIPSGLSAEGSKNLAVFYEIEGDIQTKFNTMVSEKYSEIGFNVTNPHKRVNDQYKKKFGSTVLDVLSFISIVNDSEVMPLLAKDPRLGGFSPFNMLIYKKLEDKTTHIGHLMPEAILDIVGIEDKALREAYIATFKPLDELIEKEFAGAKKSYLPVTAMSDDRMISFEYEFERPDDMDDFIEEFQNEFEMSFINKKYLIAGFHDFMEEDDAEEALEDFDIFWTYSLCHLEFSYNMFDNKGARPEAGLFAPCSMYVYVKKDSNKMYVGMPRLKNWSDTLGITDEKRLGLVNKLDREIPEVLTAFGMKSLTADAQKTEKAPVAKVEKIEPKEPVKEETPKVETAVKTEQALEPKAKVEQPVEREKESEQKIETDSGVINIHIPTPPKVPTVPKVNTINGGVDLADRSIKFSKRIPPGYDGPRFGKEIVAPKVDASAKVGEVNAGRIATYLRGELMEQAEVEKRLKDAGFTILSSSPVDKKSQLISVVFTNKELTTMASKKNRGFAASLRVLVNKKDKEISITNPLYILKAFMQDDFDEAGAKKLLVSLRESFKGLKDSEDMLKYQLLPKYQFMSGLPFYEDMEVVARGQNLLEKIKNNKHVVFTQTLDNGSTLIGVKLGKRTNKFTKRIGTNNAAMLPYPVLIENGQAKIMEPKYYISIMYPKLKMSQFMTIATVPGAMIKDCEKVFK